MAAAVSAPRRRLRQTLAAVTAASPPTPAVDSQVPAGSPELVPFGYDQLSSLLRSSWAYEHIRWMVQKDALGQDMFLLGSHSPIRRWIAFRFCEALGRECEFVSLTSDTSEADLKARRELRVGPPSEMLAATVGNKSTGVSVVWLDQAVVRAAIHGRVLVLEGLEKAERNVLPVLNNLLENREMQLEDGRFLVAPKRYDKLLEEYQELGTFDAELKSLNLVRVHERFRVIAIGVPAPPFPGNPLDPPLRSRFQARHVGRAPTEALLLALRMQYAPSVPRPVVERLVALYEAIWALGESQAGTAGAESRALAFSSLCYPCEQALISAAQLLEFMPHLTCEEALHRIFPWRPDSGLLHGEAATLVAEVMARASTNVETETSELLLTGTLRAREEGRVQLEFRAGPGDSRVAEMRGHGGPFEPRMPAASLQPFQLELLSGMLQSAAVGRDICLVGPRGEGKTFLAWQFAIALGYGRAETLFLFEDMTARDLFQRRSTNDRGESTWEPSPLVFAMEHGQLCVLDGLQRLPAGTIAALVQLIQDREVTLYDGKRYVSSVRWDHLTSVLGFSDEELAARGIHRIHPAFRLLGLAVPPESGSRVWLSNEVMQMFHFFVLARQQSPAELVSTAVPGCPDLMVQQLATVRELLHEAAADPGSPLWAGGTAAGSEQTDKGTATTPTVALSLRQMLRLARRAAAAPAGTNLRSDIGTALESALLTEFMPRVERAEVRSILKKAGLDIEPRSARISAAASMPILEADLSTSEPVLKVGDLELPVRRPARTALVPYTEFYDIPQHKLVIHEMLRDWLTSEHMLLIGNQGVGKNKLTDRVLMLLHREREYVQLHRDTTVGSLTLAPSLRDGVVVYDDSPLVKAMVHGRVLVVDEFDKAPTEVVVVLKALLEDGEILLADGRRFLKEGRQRSVPADSKLASAGSQECLIHPDFLVVALANRPGFPFLGNDFFRELGDCFACHAVRNPDQASEITLLRSYAPDVPVPLLQALTAAFRELRELVDAGRLAYPYSTRELVNIVRHLAKFPSDPLGSILENVFAFDVFDAQLREMVAKVFQRQGLPFGAGAAGADADAERAAASALAPVQTLPPPEPVARLWRQQGEGIALGATVSLQRATAPVYLPEVHWRSISPEDAEDVGGVTAAQLEGRPGAEWTPLDLHSARVERFCEEELWWRIGCVTKEGVIIKGTDPLMGSWLGDMLAMDTAQGCLCMLTSQMSLFVYDLDHQKARELPLAFGKSLRYRSTYSAGCAMLSAREDGDECLALYDSSNQALVKIWPRDGYLSTFTVPVPEGQGPVMCAGLLADLPIAVLYAVGGCELVLVACGPRGDRSITARLQCSIPEGALKFRHARILSRLKILLTCEYPSRVDGDSQLYELSLISRAEFHEVGSNVSGAEFLDSLEGGTLSLAHMESMPSGAGLHSWRLCTRPLLSSELPVPRHFAEGTLPSGAQSPAHVAANDDTLAMFAVGLDAALEAPGAAVLGYRRMQPLMAEIAAAVGVSIDAGTEPAADATGGKAVSCWHAATQSLVTAIADTSSSKLNVSHGAVLLEVVDVLQAQIRRILLSKVPGLGLEGVGRKGAGTGGSLAEQGLMMTSSPGQKTTARPHEMAACIACCQTADGRLALLFSDAHVRVLELRQDSLAVQGALFQGLLGGSTSALSREFEGADDETQLDAEDLDMDEEDMDNDDEVEGEGQSGGPQQRGRGRGNNRTGRGRGSGRGGRGRGQAGRGGSGHDGERELRRQARDGATEALREARELASKAADSQRAALDLDALDEGNYGELFAAVENEVTQLRVVLQAVEAKERERVWLRGKTTGELDDTKLVDLAIGERTVYKRRGKREEARATQRLPKRLSFVVDVSGSMAYFNGDQRLDRLCSTVVMLMEGLVGLEHKYQYEIVGHSGETHWLPLVQMGQAPRSRAERLAVVQAMVDHSSRARSGDHTLAASVHAVREITTEDADDYFVFLVSDANLRGYGVKPEDLATVLTGDKRVNAYAVFIAEPTVAEEMKAQMPAGRAHLVLDTNVMPLLFKDIFSRALASGDAKSRL